MTNQKQIISLVLVYFLIRIFSFFSRPDAILNTSVSITLLIITAYLLWKKNHYGWYLIAGEMILGGIGGFLAIGPLTLRTSLLAASMTIYISQIIKQKRLSAIINQNKIIFYLMLIIYSTVIISAINGYWQGNSQKLILADIIPYFFLLYYFSLRDLYSSENFKSFARSAIIASVAANLIFVLFTFILYSTGLTEIHGQYYQWFRDAAGGKITDLGNNFYRLVLNEQILLIPLLIYFLNEVMQKKTDKKCIIEKSFVRWRDALNLLNCLMLIFLLIILSINLSRAYILALLLSLIMMSISQTWKRSIVYSLATMFILFISFTSIHFLASRGQSPGWELFGLRLQGIAEPKTDPSALSRMLLLPEILTKIKQRPILGHGLGDTVAVYSPIIKEKINTPQFDWGYLEVIVEMGLIGFLVWLFLIGYIFSCLNLKKFFKDSQVRLWLTVFVSFLFINLTSPALFHVMGVILLTAILTFNHRSYEIKRITI